MRTLTDETETTWFFEPQDPVGPLVKALDKAGFQEIALPRQVIITGEVHVLNPALLNTALAGLTLLDNDQLGVRVRTDLIRKAEHQARVFLCTQYLLTLP